MGIAKKWRRATRKAAASVGRCMALVRPAAAEPSGRELRNARRQSDYFQSANVIKQKHQGQTPDQVMALRAKYAAPAFGEVGVWSMIEKLAECVDASDIRLGCVSQQMHVLQMLEAMEADGVATPEFQLAALVHDLGKTLLLTGEAQENVVGMNRPIGENRPGAGLDNCMLQWNHDEFAYSRLKDYLPDHIAWLVRYHSIDRATCAPFMDARDREYAERYLKPFARYDHGTKSQFGLPAKRIEDYRHVIESALPARILF